MQYTINASDLTEVQQQEFVEEFYSIDGNPLKDAPDFESPFPWGCHWLWYTGCLLGDTIAEKAQAFYEMHEDCIAYVMQQ